MARFGTLKEDSDDERRLLTSDEGRIVLQRPHHFNYTEPVIDGEERRRGKRDPEDPFYYNYNDQRFMDGLPHCSYQDWLAKGMVGAVKDQSTCGSCWAHSTLASFETLYAREKKLQNSSEVPSFSEQQLVDCNYIPNLGCIGGRRQFAFNYTIYEGMTLADKYPYQNKLGDCKYNKETDMVYKGEDFRAFEGVTNFEMEKLVC